jgi:hypothetical protein
MGARTEKEALRETATSSPVMDTVLLATPQDLPSAFEISIEIWK